MSGSDLGSYLLRRFSCTNRPLITVLCGSTKFLDTFQKANLILTVEGHIVLSIGCDMKSDNELWSDELTASQLKVKLDYLHLMKIELADEVMVLNVGGYIGASTRNEIVYAKALGKPITYWEKPEIE